MRVLLLVLLAGLGGCAHAKPDTAALVAAAIAPRPFTAEQIRAGMPAGERIRYRMERLGQPPTEEEWTVTAATPERCTIRSMVYDPTGKLVEDQGEETSTWEQLMAHATFPSRSTERTEGEIEVPAGKYPAWLYTVTEPGKGGAVEVRRYAFAKDMPGPPVKFTISAGEQELFSMTLLQRGH